MEKASILIVEDEQVVALDISNSLEESGYNVVGAVTNGEDAIIAIEQEAPDLVLMDINLEGEMDGVVTAALISDRYNLPIIYLTAYTDPTTIERVQITEPYGYLVKPFKDLELRAAVQISIYKHRLKLMSESIASTDLDRAPCISSSNSSDHEKIFDFLKDIGPFSVLGHEGLSFFVRNCEIISFNKDDIICSEGDRDIPTFIVMSGRVSMIKSTTNNKNLIVEFVSPGDLFLLTTAIESMPVPVKIKVQTKTEIIRVPKKAFLLLLNTYPEMYKGFLSYVTKRLRESYNFSRALAHDKVAVRVALALLKLLPYHGPNAKISVLRQEVAEMTGTALETVVREMKKMEREGILNLNQPMSVQILNQEALENIASF